MLPQVDTHYREATALFQRRGRLLNAPASPLDALRQLDWRLAANLDAVAIHQEGHPEASLRPPALFVETWVGLQRDSVHCLENLDEIFPKLKPEQQGAVIQAMTLSSCSGEVRHPELRAALMSEQTAMAMSEEEAAEHDALLASWLFFQDAAGADLSYFQPRYQRHDFPRSRHHSLQAGLVRRDALAVQSAHDYQDDAHFALLLALSGHPPENLLGTAFDGSVSAAGQLLDAMEQVRAAKTRRRPGSGSLAKRCPASRACKRWGRVMSHRESRKRRCPMPRRRPSVGKPNSGRAGRVISLVNL
jgi:hypothetical protein